MSKKEASFDFDLIVIDSQKLGYVYIPSESFMSFVIFLKTKENMCLDNLVTVNIDKNSHSWNVLIGGYNVKSNEVLSITQPLSETNDALKLLHKCSNLTFCVGNEDFSEHCFERRNEKSCYLS